MVTISAITERNLDITRRIVLLRYLRGSLPEIQLDQHRVMIAHLKRVIK